MLTCVYISGVLPWPSGANGEVSAHLRQQAPHPRPLMEHSLPKVRVGGVRLGRPLVAKKNGHKPHAGIFFFFLFSSLF